MLSSIEEVKTFLEDGADLDDITFVIDIMLVGVDDLNSIDIPNAPTGKGNLAGQIFVQRYLRARDSAFIRCPVVFLTERIVDQTLRDEIATIQQPGSAPVTVLQKYSQTDVDTFITTLKLLDADRRPGPVAAAPGGAP